MNAAEVKRTVFVDCPRTVNDSYVRTNAYGFDEDVDAEAPCSGDVEVEIVEDGINGNRTPVIMDAECEICGKAWTEAEQALIREAALRADAADDVAVHLCMKCHVNAPVPKQMLCEGCAAE